MVHVIAEIDGILWQSLTSLQSKLTSAAQQTGGNNVRSTGVQGCTTS